MDFFKLLKDEHKEAKDTFQKLLGQDSVEAKDCETLCKKLQVHMEMEEKYLYPRIKKIKDAEDIALEAKLEHEEAKKQIDALLNGKLDEVETKVKLEVLQLEITHHADEEESELFPVAKKHFSSEDVQDITEKMLALKEKATSKATK